MAAGLIDDLRYPVQVDVLPGENEESRERTETGFHSVVFSFIKLAGGIIGPK